MQNKERTGNDMKELDLSGIGERISRIRKERGLTLKDMVAYTGFSAGYLSNLETGKTSPTLENLRMITGVLEVDLIQLLTSEKTRRDVIRADEIKVNRYEEENMEVGIIEFGYDAQMYELIRIEPGECRKKECYKHVYSEVCTVLEGELTIQLNEQIYHLNKHDSIYIPANAPHRMWNESSEPTLSYWIYRKK